MRSGIEEGNVGHAGGEVAAAETGRRRHQQHQPERRLGLADEIGERDRRNEQHRRAEDRPVAAAEHRDRERVGKSHERADQPGQRHELKQLIGRVVEAGLRQFGRDDAPDQPDRKADMLGNDRPDEIAPGDEFALGLPEFLILRVPVRNPACRACSSTDSLSSTPLVLPRSTAPPRRFPRVLLFPSRQQKSRSLKRALRAFPRTAALLVGPSLDQWRRQAAAPST